VNKVTKFQTEIINSDKTAQNFTGLLFCHTLHTKSYSFDHQLTWNEA